MGRITGSASIETLVRVGIEKEHGLSPDSKMVVLHDFAPCVDDELEVRIFRISFSLFCLFKKQIFKVYSLARERMSPTLMFLYFVRHLIVNSC